MEKSIVLIEREGGVINYIHGNVDAKIVVVDTDIEGLSDDEITVIDGIEVYLDIRAVDTESRSKNWYESLYKMVRQLTMIDSIQVG